MVKVWGETYPVTGRTGPFPGSARAPADIWGCVWFVSPQGMCLKPFRSAQLEEIENLLANDDQELIGDFSKVGAQGWSRSGSAAPIILNRDHH